MTVAAWLAACRMRDDPQKDPSASQDTSPAGQAPNAPSGSGPRFLPGGDGLVSAAVVSAAADAQKDGRSVIVYVGATWCEPCQRFHKALLSGSLDKDLAGVTFVEFDLDRDKDRLKAAGYVSQYIPLFALPLPNGRASGKQIEGSIKGEGAAAEITPRLRELLARQR